jgi:hypothetical protein
MTIYAAKISNNIVQQIIVGDYVWANENLNGEWIDCTDNNDLTIAIGWVYDEVSDTFVAPEIITP